MQSKFYAWIIWIIGAMLFLMSSGIIALPSVLSETLSEELGFNAFENGLMSTIYIIPYTLLQVPAGALLDKYGYKKVLILSCFILVLGSAIFSQVTGISGVLFSRFLLGIGGSGIFLSSVVITRSNFSQKYFIILVSVLESLAVLSMIMLPYFYESGNIMFSWRKISFIFALLYLFIGLLILLIYRVPPVINQSNQTGLVTQIKLIISNKTILLIGIYVSCLYANISIYSYMWRIPIILSRFSSSEENLILINAYSSFGYILGVIILSCLTRRFAVRQLILSSAWFQLVFQLLSYTLAVTAYHHPNEYVLVSYYICLFLLGFFTGGIVLSFEWIRQFINSEHYGVAVGILNLSFGAVAIFLNPIIGLLLNILHFKHWWIIFSITYFVNVLGILALIVAMRFEQNAVRS